MEMTVVKAVVDEIIISASVGQSQKDTIGSMQRISHKGIPHFKKINSNVA